MAAADMETGNAEFAPDEAAAAAASGTTREGGGAGAKGKAPAAEAAEAAGKDEAGKQEDEDDDDESLLLSADFLATESSTAAAAAKQVASAVSQRAKQQSALDLLLSGGKMSDMGKKGKASKAMPKPKAAPAAPAAKASAAAAAAKASASQEEEPTTMQDGRSSLGSVAGSPSPSPGRAAAKDGEKEETNGAANKAKEEDEEDEEDEESDSGPDEYDTGYVPKPAKDLRLLQWGLWRAGVWIPVRELTPQEASLARTGGDFNLKEGSALVECFPHRNTMHTGEPWDIERAKLYPFNWDPTAAIAAVAPGSSPAPAPASASKRGSLSAPSPLTLALDEGEDDSPLLQWTPALLTQEGQADVHAQLQGRRSSGTGKKKPNRRGAKLSAQKKKDYTRKEWQTMVKFAQRTLALTVAEVRARRRKSLAQKDEDARELAAQGLDQEEEEWPASQQDAELAAALKAEQQSRLLAARGGRGTVKLAVGDKIRYKPLYKKDLEVAVIVELRPPKDEEAFTLKLDDGEMLDRDAMIEKVANYKPGPKKWAPVKEEHRKFMSVGDHQITKAAKAQQALLDLIGGTRADKAKALVEQAANDMRAFKKELDSGAMDAQIEAEANAEADAGGAGGWEEVVEDSDVEEQEEGGKGKDKGRGRGRGSGASSASAAAAAAAAGASAALELSSPSPSPSPAPRRSPRKSPTPQKDPEPEEEAKEQEPKGQRKSSPSPKKQQPEEEKEKEKEPVKGLDDSWMEEDTDGSDVEGMAAAAVAAAAKAMQAAAVAAEAEEQEEAPASSSPAKRSQRGAAAAKAPQPKRSRR